MKKKTKEQMNKIKEQILTISTLILAIDVIFTHMIPIADFVQTVLFK